METREQQLVMILADISGYTKFMVENQLAAVHGQLCITFLIETILREVNIPLHLQGIEGDAVFLYAANPGNDQAWREMLTQVRTKLARFFEVFIEAMITAGEASPCKCAICRNGKDLKLKVIVHSGRAVFNIIARTPSGLGDRRHLGPPSAQELRAEPRVSAHDRGCIPGPRTRDGRGNS